ncbi:hypothetical protein [Amorphus orientalis]|uniref:Uncharacterized protein n=1 Tax=Amorphus orientalis TaxID=649198 RepID=A0AAE3VR71_9HYPH|nr:hypothetical protein [Amorphus orientalis]MDQ0316673.1 hypothetical protein [Amorphus orientalis]
MLARFAAAALFVVAGFAGANAADPYVVAPSAETQPKSQGINGSLNNLLGFNADEAAGKPLPACGDAKVVNAAMKFTNGAEPVYRAIRVAAIDQVYERSLEVDNPSPLARRYCQGRAVLEDGRTATAYIRIEEAGGFVGLGWAVNVCLDGYDKWRVYDGHCRTARAAPDS